MTQSTKTPHTRYRITRHRRGVIYEPEQRKTLEGAIKRAEFHVADPRDSLCPDYCEIHVTHDPPRNRRYVEWEFVQRIDNPTPRVRPKRP